MIYIVCFLCMCMFMNAGVYECVNASYRRFNHFDELSGRFWLRSAAGSADSLDNRGFTRSDELLHLRALDRTCCYHDDTLSLASTCPSNGTRIHTVFPHRYAPAQPLLQRSYLWYLKGPVLAAELPPTSFPECDQSSCGWF